MGKHCVLFIFVLLHFLFSVFNSSQPGMVTGTQERLCNYNVSFICSIWSKGVQNCQVKIQISSMKSSKIIKWKNVSPESIYFLFHCVHHRYHCNFAVLWLRLWISTVTCSPRLFLMITWVLHKIRVGHGGTVGEIDLWKHPSRYMLPSHNPLELSPHPPPDLFYP